ncbi:hypothetical protein CUMW_219390, partial [Citrus unshiu]
MPKSHKTPKVTNINSDQNLLLMAIIGLTAIGRSFKRTPEIINLLDYLTILQKITSFSNKFFSITIWDTTRKFSRRNHRQTPVLVALQKRHLLCSDVNCFT